MIVITDKKTGRQAIIKQENIKKLKKMARYFLARDVKKELVVMVF